MDLVQPCSQLVVAIDVAERGVVGDVIAVPHEGVDGAQRIAFAPRQHHESIVKILGGRAGDAPANGIRHFKLGSGGRKLDGGISHGGGHLCFSRGLGSSFAAAARATRVSLRDFEIAGRRPSTAQFWLSMALRISCPPRLKSSMSVASAESTFTTSGKPCANHSRARSTSNFIIAQNAAVFWPWRISCSLTPNRRRSSRGR